MPEPGRDLSVTGDVIESSARDRRRPLLRRAAPIVAAALVGGGWLALRAAGQSPPAEPVPSVSGTGVDPYPDYLGLTGLGLGVDLGTVLIPVSPPIIVNTSTGDGRAITGVPSGPGWSYDTTDLGAGRFLLVTRNEYEQPEAFLVHGASATLVATGNSIAPGADGASVLVSQENGTAGRRVQRYDLAGTPVGQPVALGPDEYLVGETVSGWVIVNESSDEWQLCDPVSGGVRGCESPLGAGGGRPAEVMAVGGHAIAFTTTDRRLAITVTGTGGASATTAYPMPAGSGLRFRGVFSPDGRYLAIDAQGPNPIDHTILALETANGAWSGLPGTPMQITSPTTTWSGDVLVLSVEGGPAALWRPGTAAVYAAPMPG
jgi:hypothetical protein